MKGTACVDVCMQRIYCPELCREGCVCSTADIHAGSQNLRTVTDLQLTLWFLLTGTMIFRLP